MGGRGTPSCLPSCECAPGYSFVEGQGCTDVDECANDTADCLIGEQCENSLGTLSVSVSRRLSKADGLDANDCEFQIDECAEGLANCSENAACTDVTAHLAAHVMLATRVMALSVLTLMSARTLH